MNAANATQTSTKAFVRDLLRETRARDGLAPLDLERFWMDQKRSMADPFDENNPQIPLGIYMGGQCVFSELGIKEDFWKLESDPAWVRARFKEYNDIAERTVGRRLLKVRTHGPESFSKVKGLHDVFEAKNIWRSGSWWLEKSAQNEDELKALLDRIDELDIRAFILPEDWEEQKARLVSKGNKPKLYRSQRGPVTFATSVFGTEELIFLILDNPGLAERFRDTILRVMLEIAGIVDAEAGYSQETAPRGFSFYDDNCCLLNPDMYELFGAPILKAVFERYSPGPKDRRYQHSDSNMRHLLPILGRLNLTGVNFGPTLTVEQIREHCPVAVIEGQLAPFTFSRNEEEGMLNEFLRDARMAREKRGLVFTTAGSINDGSRLAGMRLIMAAIQRWGISGD